jgi:hypothetical protein
MESNIQTLIVACAEVAGRLANSIAKSEENFILFDDLPLPDALQHGGTIAE